MAQLSQLPLAPRSHHARAGRCSSADPAMVVHICCYHRLHSCNCMAGQSFVCARHTKKRIVRMDASSRSRVRSVSSKAQEDMAYMYCGIGRHGRGRSCSRPVYTLISRTPAESAATILPRAIILRPSRLLPLRIWLTWLAKPRRRQRAGAKRLSTKGGRSYRAYWTGAFGTCRRSLRSVAATLERLVCPEICVQRRVLAENSHCSA